MTAVSVLIHILQLIFEGLSVDLRKFSDRKYSTEPNCAGPQMVTASSTIWMRASFWRRPVILKN